ncbi:hypothetical protein Acsp04_25310 [Actinomadura sp. NBRC 104425]|uniref:DUF1707 SHOCT-like domain-containing protein n=1 Tax=Actinomadura sp. NBRC 104425 TaxID=3032204 RepID=UPI0024A46887|nr:DUF1707 domain-containing protein [Actinomadura sp. NBRC 104425]GLZ12296.1 hypothetical protein Acsp04_25310 [Actinomadura sp. NBRC 104425]
MPPNPDIRASDADRDRVAELLREHCAQGRITVDELNERLETVYASKTLGQLQEVTADLPEEDLYELPVPESQRATVEPVRASGVLERHGREAWGAWAAVSGINLAIWLLLAVTGTMVYPWWIWVAGPWGAVLLLITVLGRRR